jgi:hypothetical protein
MARVYVGTYKKYNSGSIAGGWISLDDCKDYGQFMDKCRALHKNERDPEFMIQDTEGFPDGLSCMERLSESEFNDVKLAMQEDEKTSLTIVDYSDKAFAVIGDTKAVKDDLKKLGGRFNGKLSCGAGWIFSNKMREAVEKFISSGNVTERESKPSSEHGSQFVTWLKEFTDSLNDSEKKYYLKEFAGAVKLNEHYYLIDKPSIENKFCFHDEGPDYEFYKHLMEDKETRLAEYFKSENLACFDNKIERITKGDFGDKRVWWNACYKNNRVDVCFYSSFGNPDGFTECTDDEKAIILKGLKFGRELFEKRLDAYLKRYGTSKLHTWTYWADA